MDLQLPNEEVIAGLQEALPVEKLFNFDIISGPTLFFNVLLDYMLHQNHIYIPNPHYRELSYGIANSCLTNPEDKDYALACLSHLRKPSLDNELHSAHQSATRSHSNETFKICDACQRFTEHPVRFKVNLPN